jgi:prepilin peptidase CpaA
MEIQFIILALCIAIAMFTDVRRCIIPNWLTVGGTVCGLIFHLVMDGGMGLLFSLVGFGAGFILLLILYAMGGLGAGDVKLFGAIGAITGAQFTLYSMMYSIFFAGFIGCILLLVRREFIKRIGKTVFQLLQSIWVFEFGWIRASQSEQLRFPFMYAVLPGVITTYLYFIT